MSLQSLHNALKEYQCQFDFQESSSPSSAGSVTRLNLLKLIEKTVKGQIAELAKEHNCEKYIGAINNSNFAGIEEFTDEFYQVLELAALKQSAIINTIHSLIKAELENNGRNTFGGFTSFETVMLYHCGLISKFYNAYYFAWCRAVQGNETAKALESNPPPKEDPMYNNHYTIIHFENGSFYETPYAVEFAKELIPIVDEMSTLVHELRALSIEDESESRTRDQYVKYFEHYAKCLTCEDMENLEKIWEELDMIWMDIRSDLQIVHCIEYGYGDPLRIKIIPDFSVRFLDDTYSKVNDRLALIRKDMLGYFEQFEYTDSKKFKNGLYAVSNSVAGVYYLPFQSSMSLHFRFSGQNIPNRDSVKELKGVKIYFDLESTSIRSKSTIDLAKKIIHSDFHSDIEKTINAVNMIIHHVGPHEYGHAFYGLSSMGNAIKASTASLLEEGRANLTCFYVMNNAFNKNLMSESEMSDAVLAYLCTDLRRFASYKSVPTRPYTISAVDTYKTAEKVGYVKLEKDILLIDRSKTCDLVNELSNKFIKIVSCEESEDSDSLEAILDDMQQETTLIDWLVKNLSN